MARPIGFSTGALARDRYRDALRTLIDLDIAVVELSALRLPELEPLVRDLPDLDLDAFEYVSLHAPSRIPHDAESAVARLLEAAVDRMIPIVVHPDSITDFELWRPFGELLLIENMDRRKSGGRTVQELQPVFEALPDARLCFDIAHARQVDPSMTVGYEILTTFKDRLSEIHISNVSTASSHSPVSYMAAWDFSELTHLIPPTIPIIIESTVGPSDVLAEVQRVRRILDPSGGVGATIPENPLS
jgi:hypothetical protein